VLQFLLSAFSWPLDKTLDKTAIKYGTTTLQSQARAAIQQLQTAGNAALG
jgi:hypothetical protein